MQALLPGLETTAEGKTGLKFPFGELNYQAGIDFGILPILFKGIYKPLNQRGIQRQYQISVQIGPSTKGWAYKDFIIKAGIKMENPNDNLEALGRFGSALGEKYKTKTAEETKNAIFKPLMEKAKAMFNR